MRPANVLILGAGPAGCAAALTALDAGLDVTLIERSRLPRHRPGETLHPGIEPLLRQLGVLEPILSAGYLRHTGHWVEWKGPSRFVRYGGGAGEVWRGFQAPRADFDEHLLTAARERGATVMLGRAALSPIMAPHRVSGIHTQGAAIASRVTIDCGGGSHWLARQLGVYVRRYSPPLVARFGYATGRRQRRRLPMMRSDRDGWTWVAEVEPGRFHWTRVTRRDDRPSTDWAPRCFRNLRREHAGGADVTWRMAARTAGPGWFLAGDAAAVLDPSSSHGVLRAMMTGMLAGHLAATLLRQPAAAADCERAYHQHLSAWFQHDAQRMAQAYRAADLFQVPPPPAHTRPAAD